MKQQGGLPPAFRKGSRHKSLKKNEGAVFMHEYMNTTKPSLYPDGPRRQTEKSGLSQLLKKSRNPFTGPGPATAGRRRRTRRRKH